MRFGCCANMISPVDDPGGLAQTELIAEAGFDYVELSLSHVTALGGAAFESLVRRVAQSGLQCEACNNFFPASVRLTGPDADLAAATEYAEHAIARAATLGAGVIVFGSSAARNVPDGFPRDLAWRQLVELLRSAGAFAERHGIEIWIEALNRPESNIVNDLPDAVRLSDEVSHPRVGVLIDSYHLLMEGESIDVLKDMGDHARHVHVAAGRDRRFPLRWDAELPGFFEGLRDIGYTGRCSIEAYTDSFAQDAKAALAMLRRTEPWRRI
jgi:D-psicose/D-tagatose/L-ribulose 3-epimerase